WGVLLLRDRLCRSGLASAQERGLASQLYAQQGGPKRPPEAVLEAMASPYRVKVFFIECRR
ncbi:hypothetical protein, partial [Cupriavidus basilensis]|uniref:hypothetical protein n=1 Tax=Cupriavidus basilensis TaxID=68895 RepID=UPI001ED947F0